MQKTLSAHHTHQNNDPNTRKPSNPMLELPHEHLDLDDPHQHIKNIDTLSIPYPMKITHPPPKPYKLRPKRVPKTLNTRKIKTQPQYPQHDNQRHLDLDSIHSLPLNTARWRKRRLVSTWPSRRLP